MGDGSRAARVLLGLAALTLAAGCGVGRPASPSLLPAPSMSASLTTTGPEDPGPTGRHEYVDPRIAEPPGGVTERGPVFVWSRGSAPTTPFGAVDVALLQHLVDTDLSDADVSRADIAVAVTFTSPEAARGTAERLRADLPRAVTRYDHRDAVVVLGSSVFVRGIPSPAANRSVRGLLRGYPGDVLVEGDRYGEGSIVADLSCRPTERARAQVLAGDLDDYASTPFDFFLRPPWARPALTGSERLARSTYTRFNDFLEDAADADPETQELWFHYREAHRQGDVDRMSRVQNRISERRRELSPARLEGEYDPKTLAALRTEPLALDAKPRWSVRVGRRMGQLPVRRQAGDLVAGRDRDLVASPALLTVRLGERLDISTFLPIGHFAPSLASLVLHLHRAGCADVRYRLLDWDDVRVD
ncbi:MAG TPA: hypothetical protein VK204_02925 [Nocardioidaceae bacterium]|nr:hypothetical protein [Nocardioidaceae bacterium]